MWQVSQQAGSLCVGVQYELKPKIFKLFKYTYVIIHTHRRFDYAKFSNLSSFQILNHILYMRWRWVRVAHVAPKCYPLYHIILIIIIIVVLCDKWNVHHRYIRFRRNIYIDKINYLGNWRPMMASRSTKLEFSFNIST